MRVSRDFGLIFEEIYQGIFKLKQVNNTLVSVTSIDVNPQKEFELTTCLHKNPDIPIHWNLTRLSNRGIHNCKSQI